MDRAQLQRLVEDRVVDAQALLSAGRWSAAYYLIGYAVECGLKSCILAHLAGNVAIIFEEGNKRYSEKCWSHNVDELVGLAGLERQRKTDTNANSTLGNNWMIAKDWKETSRYKQTSEVDAKKLWSAVTDNPDGVLRWIKSHW
ncbi:MAG TPA: hypothetical protein VGZ26_11040 [Pirellulales bacterium]|nr:hypothetical protein [Pirellulales bacterium]